MRRALDQAALHLTRHAWICLLLLLFSCTTVTGSGGPEKVLDTSGPVGEPGVTGSNLKMPDLSGEWDIQEQERSYRGTLDHDGNGTYTWQNGRIVTTRFVDRKWEGTWHQSGNDREGGFELLLSEDGSQAKGIWWYTRVGERDHIPPKQFGGTYLWNRLSHTIAKEGDR